MMQVARDAPVDVQIGPVLYEDAPQELRSRMWWALLENPKLVSLLGTERVCVQTLSTYCHVHLASANGSAGVSCSSEYQDQLLSVAICQSALG